VSEGEPLMQFVLAHASGYDLNEACLFDKNSPLYLPFFATAAL
jgi:hypothetical protein